MLASIVVTSIEVKARSIDILEAFVRGISIFGAIEATLEQEHQGLSGAIGGLAEVD